MRFSLLIFIFLMFSFDLKAGYKGYPEFNVYPLENYGFHAQTLGICQDSTGLMFFANNLGLIYFDGRNWTQIPNPHSAGIFSVARGLHGQISYGGDGDFGIVEKRTGGHFAIRSLTSLIPEKDFSFQEVWSILSHPSGTLFCSKSGIFRWDGESIKVYRPTGPEGFHKFFSVGERIIVREFGVGLMEWTAGGFRKLRNGDYFSDIKVDFIVPMGSKWRIGTREQGFFDFDPDGASAVKEFRCEAGDFMKSAVLYHGILLNDRNFAFATHKKGVVICDSLGRILEVYDGQDLQANKTWFLFQDKQQNLWIANDRAVCTADYSYPLRWFARRQITANSVTMDEKDRVWVATGEGLFMSNTGSPLDPFIPVPGHSGNCFSVLNFNCGGYSCVLASTVNGLQVIEKSDFSILEQDVEYGMLRQSKKDSSLLVAAGRGLISVYRYAGKRWQKIFSKDDIDGRLLSVTEDALGRFWITGEEGFVICLKVKDQTGMHPTTVQFTFSDASPFRGEYLRCFTFQNRLFFSATKVMMEYVGRLSSGELKLKTPSDFAPELCRGFIFFQLHETSDGRLWISGEKSGLNVHGFLSKDKNGKFYIDHLKLSKLQREQVNGAFCDDRGMVWLASNGGIISFNSNTKLNYETRFPVVLSVHTGQANNRIFSGGSIITDLVFPFADNNIKLSFQALSYNAPNSIVYSFLLEGLDTKWGSWESVNTMAYNSLFEGNYSFRVKARDIYGNVSEASYLNFKILPPWYRTWWAYIAYLFVGIMGIRQIVRFNTSRLKSLNEYLDRTVSQRTHELNIEKEKLTEANREITDSINYARFIQRSILPSEEFIHPELKSSFIFYRPRDIVSGDFYWFDQLEHTSPSTQIIVLADCTGHGVPGAFMSMIGSEKLNQAVHDIVDPDPAKMLVFMNQSVSKAMRKGGGTESHDGMEMGICFFRPGSFTLQYAGANRPLWIFRKDLGDFELIKPTKCGIAGGASIEQEFVLHDISLKRGDRVFMFSDGAPDQFGGERGRKLTSKGFRDALLEIQKHEITAQKSQLEEFYLNWMKGQYQVDDILIIGFEV